MKTSLQNCCAFLAGFVAYRIMPYGKSRLEDTIMFNIQCKQTDTNLLCKSSHIIVAFLIVLTGFNVTWAVFDAPIAWEFFDPNANGVGLDPKGNVNGAFDGRYIYFAPVKNNTEYHAEVLRYDTWCEFSDPNCWATFDYGKAIGDPDIAGYTAVIYDGSRYLYFNPWINNDGHHGNVLRHDTWGEFTDPNAWLNFDLETIDATYKGFGGFAFDGKYIYMSTYNAYDMKSRLARYNTTKDFNEPNSWEVLRWENFRHNCVRPVFDGQYVYFARLSQGEDSWIHRYDTTNPDPNSFFTPPYEVWEKFDTHDIREDLESFVGTAYANPYVYFVTWRGLGIPEDYNSLILRYDTNLDFHEPNSWEFYESDDVYIEIVNDDERYLYFTPRNEVDVTGQFLRFDTTKDFNNDPNAWKYFDPGENGVGDNLKNYNGGVSDGHYVYFTPWEIEGSVHGEILRYDSEYGYGTCWDPDECAGQPFGDATCDGDVNAGAVNLGDLLALKKAWGASGPPWIEPYCCADFNHDGKVNLGDLLILKENWGRTGFTPSTENHMCPE